MNESVGLRALRQDASELIRRVESGETIEVTVAGRLAARLVPATPTRWRRWSDVEAIFQGPKDDTWAADRALLDDDLRIPEVE